MSYQYVIGVDNGTDSVRSFVINAPNGSEITWSMFFCRRWKLGKYCDAAVFNKSQTTHTYFKNKLITKSAVIGKESETKKMKSISTITIGLSALVAVSMMSCNDQKNGEQMDLKKEITKHFTA